MNPFVADPEWGIWIILYFYLGGIAAGAYFLATLVALFGQDEDRVISRIGYRLALPLIAVCGVLLIVDLDRPERFWHMMFQSEVVHEALDEGWPLGGWGTMIYAINVKHWSPMSIGAWALALFGACSTLSFVGTLWNEGRLHRLLARGVVGRTLQVFGSLVGFFVSSYTGVLLSATNQPLWSVTDGVGPLFLASSASTGIAAVLLFLRFTDSTASPGLEKLERADLWAVWLELLVFLLFVASLLPDLLPLTLQTKPGRVLVLGTFLLGLAIPLVLHRARAGSWQAIAAAVSALFGGLALRYGMLETAPALLNLGPEAVASTATGAPSPGVVAVGLVVILIAATLWVGRLRRDFTVGQKALAVLGTLLGCVLFLAYGGLIEGLRPPTGHLLGCSPEDARVGGVGASSLNRPDPGKLRMRSKILGMAHER